MDDQLPKVTLVAGRGPAAWRWRARWERRLGLSPSEPLAKASHVVAFARTPNLVDSTTAVAWWLDGDEFARALDAGTADPLPDLVRRILVTTEMSRQRILQEYPEKANEVILIGEMDLAVFLGAVVIPGTREPKTVLIAGHDFRFIEPIAADLRSAGHSILWDPWADGSNHDQDRSRRLLEEADTVVCEWALGNSVWYSREVANDQRLIVRLHRYELGRPFGPEVEMERVSHFVTVSDFIADAASQTFGWPRSKITVIPNGVDVVAMGRSKRPGWERRLGLVGYGTPLKRFDLALDILGLVRRSDPDFTLLARGRRPEEMPWVWHDQEARAFSLRQRQRLQEEPHLRDAVAVSDYVPGLAEWMRDIGFILSLSEVESFHVALAEGMASRATPVILQRDGVADMWEPRWVHATVDEAAEAILSTVQGRRQTAEGEAARQWVARRYDQPTISSRWAEII